jgi:hypothetical protein
MKKLFLFLFLLLIQGILSAQVIFEPTTSSVYEFLNRLSVRGIVEFQDELRPLARIFIAEKLLDAEENIQKLSEVEKEDLKYYEQDYYIELETIKKSGSEKMVIFRNDKEAGFRPFLYRDKNFSFTADPILGLSYKRQYDDNFTHRWNGLKLSGYYDNFGYSFYFKDNEESGTTIDTLKRINPEPGLVLHAAKEKSFDYSNVRGMVSFSWKWGSIDFGKDYIEWGSGRRGQLILSNKAPSFVSFRLIAKPIEWLQFQYIHGWLYSGIIDSSSIRATLVGNRESFFQQDKFIAAHILSFYPVENISFSLGESVIYSKKLEPIYFIPVIFFRLSDHYLSGNSNTGDNAQVFANAVYKNYSLRAKVYGTLFIDELSLTNVLKGGNLSSIAYTLGLNLVDPVIKNSELVVEYTQTDPFIYMNSNDLQLYTSHSYQLGHWIGSNAKQIYASYKQWLLRGLSVNFWGEYIAKGQTELPEQQYELPYPEVLYGPRLNITSFGIDAGYEIYRELRAHLYYQYSNITDNEKGRTLEFKLGSNHIFGISLVYGF